MIQLSLAQLGSSRAKRRSTAASCTTTLRFTALLAAALFWSASYAQAQTAPQPEKLAPQLVQSEVCSSCSAGQARLILDNLHVKANLEFAFEDVPAVGEAQETSLTRVPLSVESRLLVNGHSTLQLARSEHPGGGWEIFVIGRSDKEAGVESTANPQVEWQEAHQTLSAALSELVQSAGNVQPRPVDLRDLAFEVYPLSYAQSDRTLALLKAMGYTTVEFKESDLEQSRWEKIFEVVEPETTELPVIVKLLDSDKTSLLQPIDKREEPAQKGNQQEVKASSAIPEIGGQFLHQTSTGEPLQRLLLLYDPAEPSRMQRLLRLLEEVVDIPARQIVIEAVVIEVNTERLGDLGFSFQFGEDKTSGSFTRDELGRQQPFNLTFNDLADLKNFEISLSALVEDGDAEILSNPSVLVLDGRQARIQVGQQIPIVSSAATVGVIAQSVEYFPVGIVLNLRPRLNRNASDVTMQVETIVSAVTSNSTLAINNSDDVFFAPTIDNRRVQTLVRVADNTPFIIGGLISTEERERISRVPGLSRIPYLGELFKRRSKERIKTEVIVVITPHVVPADADSFNYVIPKESDRFDSFDHSLFRNTYRIRQGDVFDLRFVEDSGILNQMRTDLQLAVRREPELELTPSLAKLLAGETPGEHVLVQRMLWETVRRSKAAASIQNDRIILFERPSGSADLELRFLKDLLNERAPNANTLRLAFPADSSSDSAPRLRPAAISYQSLAPSELPDQLKIANGLDTQEVAQTPTILLDASGVTTNETPASDPLQMLKSILVLKRILDLNKSLPLEIDEFYVGRQIVYPSEEDLTSSFHVVDERAAKLFFEVQHYYPAFEAEFNRALADARRLLEAEN